MMLYRPVGIEELRLVYESALQRFPPRLPEQPIFYPVLNIGYAEQIARDWNTKSGSFAGYVTQFAVDDGYVAQFERHIVGGREHEELWVPAEQLDEFNRHISGRIVVVGAYFGPQFRGYIPDRLGMKGRDAIAQFMLLAGVLDYSRMDFRCEITANDVTVFLHFPFWAQHDFSREGIAPVARDRVLAAIKEVWSGAFPEIPLGVFNQTIA